MTSDQPDIDVECNNTLKCALSDLMHCFRIKYLVGRMSCDQPCIEKPVSTVHVQIKAMHATFREWDGLN